MPISKTGIGIVIVTLVEAVLPIIGVEVAEGSTAAAVEGVMTFVGFVLMVYGQIDRKDLSFGLLRNE